MSKKNKIILVLSLLLIGNFSLIFVPSLWLYLKQNFIIELSYFLMVMIPLYYVKESLLNTLWPHTFFWFIYALGLTIYVHLVIEVNLISLLMNYTSSYVNSEDWLKLTLFLISWQAQIFLIYGVLDFFKVSETGIKNESGISQVLSSHMVTVKYSLTTLNYILWPLFLFLQTAYFVLDIVLGI